ncbi:oligosaccharide flippase family protein [Mesorhizobium australicum]|uniref:Polysaccharide transporter, PST family n=1 Tax=Mesorhizobium australicum TaxID=536018 RepID=A0A1X7NRF4_9HYPH|nr:oligosaccharide flippase family protein [Mesorhizobium australicum]SMH40661.1 polysaccharide transporter, PST family [Mesorhizobium australicum]
MSILTKEMYLSLAVMWAAHSVNSIISLVRMKLIALLVGPAGIGVLGLFQSFQSTATTLAGLGLTTSSVRELAGARSDEHVFSVVQSALFVGLFLQGSIAMLAVWLLRSQIAIWIFNDPSFDFEIGVLGITILLTMIGSSQVTLLQGLRRVKDLGKIMTISALISTVVGVTVIWWIGDRGIVWFMLTQSVIVIVVAHAYVRRLGNTGRPKLDLRARIRRWSQMVHLGIPFMLGALVAAFSLLTVRAALVESAGLDVAGYFSASWSISLLYVNFILQAMNTDYFPRLSETDADHRKTSELINTQILVNLSIGGPIILVTIVSAPWLIRLLYSASFAPTAELLQWQALGNALKLFSLPLSYVLVARGHSIVFFLAEVFWNGLFIGIIVGGFESLGLTIVGVAYLVAYAIFLALHVLYLRAKLQLLVSQDAVLIGATVFVAAAIVMFLSRNFGVYGLGFGVVFSLAGSAFGIRVAFARMARANTPVPARIRRIYAMIGWHLPASSSATDGNEPIVIRPRPL